MDPGSMATAITNFLAPLLPYLLKGSEKGLEEVGKKLGEATWNRAIALWARLRPRLEAMPATHEVVQEVAKAPSNQVAHDALILLVRDILAEDSNLTQEVAHWLKEARRAGVLIAVASGDRSVAVGGALTGSTIITGDGNL